jgi:hypothetical protein
MSFLIYFAVLDVRVTPMSIQHRYQPIISDTTERVANTATN